MKSVGDQRPKHNRGLLGRALGLMGLLCAPQWAHAQDATAIAGRRELLQQAQTARRAGDHRRALDLATRAAGVEWTPSLRGFVAEEQAALGQLAEAMGNADLCAREAERDTSVSRASLTASCQALANRLRSQVGRIVVQFPAAPPVGVEVRVQGRPLPEVFFGAPFVVNPGPVTIDATAVGWEPWHWEINVPAGQSTTFPVTMRYVGAPQRGAVPNGQRMNGGTGAAVLFEVSVEGNHRLRVPNGGECSMPCTLRLAPGPLTVAVTGDHELEMPLAIPRANAVRIRLVPSNRGRFYLTGGLWLLSGLLLLPLGILSGAAARSEVVAYTLGSLGVGFLVGSVIFFIVGAVSKPSADTVVLASRRRLQWNLGAVPRPGGVEFGLSIRF